MKYFIDTNICIYALKNKFPRIKEMLKTLSPSDIAILILTNLGATTESCRVASTNTVNICRLSVILGGVGAGLRARPVKISFS